MIPMARVSDETIALRQSTPETFWSRVSKGSECWLWTGAVYTTGYGRIWYRGRAWTAHRLAWVLTNGTLPNGRHVNLCHHCDERLCCRPSHMYVGTVKSNAMDRHRRGRANTQRGSKHHQARLSLEDVVEIRQRRADGETTYALAARYGVSQQHISNVTIGKRWAHINSVSQPSP